MGDVPGRRKSEGVGGWSLVIPTVGILTWPPVCPPHRRKGGPQVLRKLLFRAFPVRGVRLRLCGEIGEHRVCHLLTHSAFVPSPRLPSGEGSPSPLPAEPGEGVLPGLV